MRPIIRRTQDIQNWRNSIIWAEGLSQQRFQLYDLYHDMLSDGHLLDACDKRIKAVTNRPLTFMNAGKVNEDIVNLTKKTFFRDFVKHAIESIFWGHSLCELYWPAKGTDTVGKTFLVPRKHVKPRFGIVTKFYWEIEGIDYTQIKNIIAVGDGEDLGLLLPASQYVIYKRGDFGDWAEYAEVFGMPFRWATYNNESSREVLTQALAEAGSAGYVVAPADATIQFLNSNTANGSEVFKMLRDACNEEISITILGNTMTTTEAKSSGYAQSLTHLQVQGEKHKDDRALLLSVLNEKVLPYLATLGYDVTGEFSYEDEAPMPLKDRLEIDLKVADKVPIADSYWYETYKIPKPSTGEITQKKESPQKPDKALRTKQQKKKVKPLG